MKNKNCTAIICEYNPFHNGHAYQISEAKKKSEIILCIMSGNTVQRGGFACADKYERAKIAVDYGADIVVEHPFPYCTSSASDFSTSGVYIAKSLCATHLAFGHEGDVNTLIEISNLLYESDFSKWLKDTYINDKESKKLSFPKLREKYISYILGEEKASALKLPNNILSVEYLLNLKKYPHIKPMFIKRNFDFISAGDIREKIQANEKIENYVPQSPDKFFNFSKSETGVLTYLNLVDEYNDYYDCDESLYNRIKSVSKESLTLDDLIYKCTTSAYTSSKVRRAVYSILFNITKSRIKQKPRFTILLGASTNGLKYISENKKEFEIPIFTRASDDYFLNANDDFAFKADRLYKLYNNEKFSPYQKPYILKN